MSDINTRTVSGGGKGVGALDGPDSAAPRVDFWLFVVMLVLAIVGVGVSQALESGGRLYWGVLVVIYAVISIARSYLNAKRQQEPSWSMIRAQVLHWVGALVAIYIVLWFESWGVTDRGPASDYSLLVLALSCYLAGVHFDWSFILLGCILAIIAVGLGLLDQLSIFLVTIPLAVLAIWFVYKRKFASAG